MGKIITLDEPNNYLRSLCFKVESKEEGEEIANELFREITDNKGIGLSAPQIGKDKCVFAIKVNTPLYFVNPKITPEESGGKFVFLETCLSLPKIAARTERWRTIVVEADNFVGKKIFDISDLPQEYVMMNSDALEVAAIQHEYDHLLGILMTDDCRKYIDKPFNIKKVPGRNEKIKIQKNYETITIKYKHLQKYISDGWIVNEKHKK